MMLRPKPKSLDELSAYVKDTFAEINVDKDLFRK